MSKIDDVLASGYKGRNNDERPQFVGDFVCIVKEFKKAKDKWIIWVNEIINVVVSKDGNQGVVGDEIAKLYDSEDENQVQRFLNDLTTAGIETPEAKTEADLLAALSNAVDKKVFMRAWLYDKKDGSGKAQSIAVKSYKMLTEQNSTPALPF